jgi:beta-lactamase class A
MMIRKSVFCAVVILCLCLPGITEAQTDSLKQMIRQVVQHANGTIGAAFENIETGDTLSVAGSGHFPMQSVYKFPLALAVLKQVDAGKLSLGQKLFVTKKDLRTHTWSPLREQYPRGDTALTLDEILAVTVSRSDNNGCDILFRLLGGTAVVHRFIHDLGITDIAVAATEEEMAQEWNVQFRNWCTPLAMRNLIRMFYEGKILSKQCTAYLLHLLEGTTTAPKRLKGLLPAQTVVAHKTGTSDTNEQGVTAATNDAGIITLPNGQHAILVVFVSNSSAPEAEREAVIAKIAKCVWDVFGKKE